MPPPPPPPPPPPLFSGSFLSSLDLDFLNLAGLSALATMVVFFIYSCYEHKYSDNNQMQDIERGGRRRTVSQSPASASASASASSGGDQRTPSTAVICTKLFQYGVGGIEGKNTDCSICLDDFTEGEACRMLPKCEHIFHRYCIDQWLPTERHCPICRSSVHVRAIYPNHRHSHS